jgi:DNA-binding transcriptional LysR family regulator
MTVFARVAASRSFSGAARELGISQATASKHVQTLEDWLGVRLLHRTTRRVALTDAGENFYVQCSRILDDMEAARNATQPEATVRGSMRITAPVVFGSTRLGPLVVDFLQLHPELSMSVELSDRSVDLIEEGYDLAIRTRPVDGSGLVSQRLMPLNYVLCASTGYIARHGMPSTPADLGQHHCITGTDNNGGTWRFDGPDGGSEVQIYGRLQVNNALLRRDAARSGAGVLLCADYLVEDDIAAGRLVRLLPGYTPSAENLHAVCPVFRAATPKVRSLISHLTARLAA